MLQDTASFLRTIGPAVTSTSPHHRFQIDGHQGYLSISVSAALTAPWTVLFGPSGSGKSTLLRALAGLTPNLHVTFDRHHPTSGAWTSLQLLPTQQRNLAYDPQGAPLLPHLSVLDNLRFPETLRAGRSAPSLVPEITDMLQLSPLLNKRPHQLSGGERQRISLARALAVPGAKLLLLDEPFAGLDRTLRDQLLPPLRAYLSARNLPVLSVTHDADEALLLEADVLRLDCGRLTAQGHAHEVLADEITRLRDLLNST